MDKFISVLIVLLLLIGAVLMTFFTAVQVRGEGGRVGGRGQGAAGSGADSR